MLVIRMVLIPSSQGSHSNTSFEGSPKLVPVLIPSSQGSHSNILFLAFQVQEKRLNPFFSGQSFKPCPLR